MNILVRHLFVAGCLAFSNFALTAIANPDTTSQTTCSVTITAPGMSLVKLSNPPVWEPISSNSSAEHIDIVPERRFQQILGFGGAFTDASCFVFDSMPPDKRADLFHDLFAQDSLALNVCRTCIGASDYSTSAYSFDEGAPDPDLKRFSIDHDRKYILPMLKEASAINPNLFLFSTPWSPPGWMKSGQTMLGGTMLRRYLPVYANYFAKFLKAYKDEGVKISAVTVQNEVDTAQDGNMPACAWPQELESDFVEKYLGPTLQENSLSTTIWLIDHNYNLWGRALGELESPAVRKFASGIAWHGYLGEPEMMTRVHWSYPKTAMYWTEGGPDFTDKTYANDWTKWGFTFTDILNNWCESITTWNLALDEKGKPNIGPFNCGGLVTVNSNTKEVTRSGQYYALAQFSKFIKRGAFRIEANGSIQDLRHVAFVNPDGHYVVVLSNKQSPKKVTLRMNGSEISLSLEADSIATVTW